MSLHTLAHHLQAAGRGDDKVLVHMTPKEVGGLQALAHAHGGSLTVNPHTGLPEAGFLSSLLPMLAGFALGPAGFALMSAPMAGLAVGAATGLATGDLKKGLMAGIGAYGGAGLGQALGNTGATQLANAQYAPQGAQWAEVSKNLAKPITDVASTGAEAATNAANVATQGGLPAYTPYANAVSNTVPVGAPVPAQSAMYAQPAVVPAPAAPAPAPYTPTPIADFSRPALPEAINPYASTPPAPSAMDKLGAGFKHATGSWEGAKELYEAMPTGSAAALGITALDAARQEPGQPKKDESLIRPYEFTRTVNPGSFDTGAPIWSSTPGSSAEKTYFTETMTPRTPYKAPGPEYAAKGGLMGLAVGGPVETMSAQNAVGSNMMYPQANINTPMYANPAVQHPEAVNIIAPTADAGVGEYSGEARFAFGGEAKAPETKGGYSYSYDPKTLTFTQTGHPEYDTSTGRGIISQALAKAAAKNPMSANGTTYGGIVQPTMQAAPAQQVYTPPPVPAYQSPEQQLGLGGFYDNMNSQLSAMGYAAGGGVSHLGGYSDGGRLLKGPGDGVSDSIPATIGNRQPARLADGEFVIPARIVSELGNGSTDAGAKRLYAMMDRVQKARRKTVGKDRVAANTNAEKYLPA